MYLKIEMKMLADWLNTLQLNLLFLQICLKQTEMKQDNLTKILLRDYLEDMSSV